MRRLLPVLIWVGTTASLAGATLEKLGLDDMIVRSTAIVRGRAAGSYAAQHGALIYTHWRIQVTERLKGDPGAQVDVVVPGGVAGGYRQTFSGTPSLAPGTEYVLFLWTGRNGLTHMIGLSQGVLTLQTSSKGEQFAARAAASGPMLDPRTGAPVEDEPVRITLSALRERIRARVGTAKE